MKKTRTIKTALLCGAGIAPTFSALLPISASPEHRQNLPRQSVSTTTIQIPWLGDVPPKQPASRSWSTWSCEQIGFPDDMCLCIPTDCQLFTDPDCTSKYIIKGVLGCDDDCNGCQANECEKALCG
ncbi:hypothetical protein PG995_003971 [Apiospora arundinis]